jgi:hypothetical protein
MISGRPRYKQTNKQANKQTNKQTNKHYITYSQFDGIGVYGA